MKTIILRAVAALVGNVAYVSAGLNYIVTFNGMEFSDNAGNFELKLDYDIGEDASGLNVSLFEIDCVTNYTGPVVTVKNTNDVDEILSVEKKYLSIANTKLVTHEENKGLSKGSLQLCVMAETFVGQISAGFQKQNLKLDFDLTENNFSVLSNNIITNAVTTANLTVTTEYVVEACQCEAAVPYNCLDSPTPEIGQNQLVSICVFPALENRSAVEVSNFFMEFKVNDVVLLTPVSIGTNSPQSTTLSVITKSGDIHKVTTRLITKMFEGGNTNFNVEGNAYLQFKSEQVKKSRDRSLQDADAGDSFFSMQVQTKKEANPAKAVSPSGSKSGVMSLSVVGGCLTLAVAFVVILKKMKK